MKLCRFIYNGTARIGKIVGDSVVDLSTALEIDNSMRALLQSSTAWRDRAAG